MGPVPLVWSGPCACVCRSFHAVLSVFCCALSRGVGVQTFLSTIKALCAPHNPCPVQLPSGGEQSGTLPLIEVPFGPLSCMNGVLINPTRTLCALVLSWEFFCLAERWLKWHHFVLSASALHQAVGRAENTSAVCLHTATLQRFKSVSECMVKHLARRPTRELLNRYIADMESRFKLGVMLQSEVIKINRDKKKKHASSVA